MKRALLAALLALFTSLALAQATPGNERKGAAAPPSAEEQAIRARLQQTFNISPSSITRTPFGWYEAVVNTDVIYVDPTANYVFANGSVIDTRTRENLTQARKDDLMKVDFAKLPLDQAVRIRFGKGSRQFVTFEDPNCGFCKKLHNDLRGLKDATVYVFLYPILSPDSTEKAKAIWCSKNRADAWNDWMLEGKAPTAGGDCKNPIQQTVQLGQSLGINGTPTLIFPDGSRLPGAVGVEAIEKKLAESGRPRK
ncbi:MAG: DsbC family protein [Burkholderiales bacterium]|nr:DsbC family protein [Burkholderiales bacterium]